MRRLFAGTFRQTLFVFRAQRLFIAIWLCALVAFSAFLAPAFAVMFDDNGRAALAEALQNPAMVAIIGPVYGADNYTPAAMYAGNMLLWVLLAVCVMNVVFICGRTRADEEAGRAELLRSLPAGRLICLHTAISAALLINLALALLTGLALASFQLTGFTFAGCMLYGAVLGAGGFFAAALTALLCQLFSSSRSAMGVSFGVLGLLFLLRAYGDIFSEPLALISPLGMLLRARVFTANSWQPVIAVLIESICFAASAYMLSSERDLGCGLLPARRGRTAADFSLRSSFGLALRLTRGSVLIWLLVFFLLGASYGSILGDIDSFIDGSPVYQAVIGVVPGVASTEMFAAMVNSIMAALALAPLLPIVSRPREEELSGRAELTLSRAVSRVTYYSGYLIIAAISSVLLQIATAAGLYTAAALVLPGSVSFGFLLGSNLVYLPAIWFFCGLCVLLVGLLPKAYTLVWAYFAFCFFGMFLSRIAELPPAVNALSPFEYIPRLPVGTVHFPTLAALTAVSLLCCGGGLFCFCVRDSKA